MTTSVPPCLTFTPSTDWFLLLVPSAGSATHPLKVERAAADAVVHQSLFAGGTPAGLVSGTGPAAGRCAYLAEFFTVAWPVKTRTNTRM